ncbi:Transcription factor [Sesamum angolense]|uniref:Transcription factor n=1 Tax=Sesamum angolense TaxID=2727404 RepID=A0AAE1WUH2_9LAMI|nr:Transcription factor [Sesamum angolense]
MQQHNSIADAYIGIGGGGGGGAGGGGSPLTFPQVSEILPWTLPPYFGYEGGSSDHQLRLISESLGQVVHPISAPFGLQAELQKMTAQEIMDAKALAASKSHSEAERRRRERINNHLARLRSLLPSTTKVSSMLYHYHMFSFVEDVKNRQSFVAGRSNPTYEDGKWVLKASICCEDRPDLLPDLIKTLKALRLRTVKAEITTLGGRVRNVLFITGEEEYSNSCEEEQEQEQEQYSINSIQEALKAVMEKSNGDESGSSGSVKRQRTNTNILEYRSL